MREKVWRFFKNRGDNGDANDTNATIAKIVKLRAERATLLGYASHAHWRMSDTMAKDPKNANAWNYLGYSQRKTGQTADALKSYTAALDIDPKHKGAHEYLGELYLMTDNLPKAEETLKKLQALCSGCDERKELEKAVAAYKKAKGISS